MKDYEGMNLAQKLFDLQTKKMLVERDLYDLLDVFEKPFYYDNFRYDYYDGSLELFGVPDTYKLRSKDAKLLKEAGFNGVWTHLVLKHDDYKEGSGIDRKSQGERYYCLH